MWNVVSRLCRLMCGVAALRVRPQKKQRSLIGSAAFPRKMLNACCLLAQFPGFMSSAEAVLGS